MTNDRLPPTKHASNRRLPVGAEWLGLEEGVDFRVWAPRCSRVELVWGPSMNAVALVAEGTGYHRAWVPTARVGARYRFRLDGRAELYPDPISRSQPDGPHGASEVVDPGAFAWTDEAWNGVSLEGQIIYEMHIGTFTREGTWDAACGQLAELARVGITTIEVMPISEFPGLFGWGYDGVNLFAPSHLYGAPDDARRFVDAAHSLGIGVIIDVVYNHLGPDGNYLPQFSDTYFTTRHKTDWGPALNFYGPGSEGTRELIVTNAAYWVDEFHFDGLRLDATQNIYDESPDHILAAVSRAVRSAAGARSTFIVAENEPQQAKLVRSREDRGYGLDALWNDDFHHSAHVALTGRAEAYYMDYAGTPQELISSLKWGYLYQGQHSVWQNQRRGTHSFDVAPARFVSFLENHDQVANSARGERVRGLSSPARHRALVALLLLGPGTPMLFQGEEFGTSSPFLFFADHGPELATLVRTGRREFLSQFPTCALPEVAAGLPAPDDRATFERCKLDFSERERHRPTAMLYEDLIALRRRDATFGRPSHRGMDGAVLSQDAFALRFFGASPDGDRLVLVNLGADLRLPIAPEPLLASPDGTRWQLMWSSENPRYGGEGGAPPERDGIWHLAGQSTVAMRPEKAAP